MFQNRIWSLGNQCQISLEEKVSNKKICSFRPKLRHWAIAAYLILLVFLAMPRKDKTVFLTIMIRPLFILKNMMTLMVTLTDLKARQIQSNQETLPAVLADRIAMMMHRAIISNKLTRSIFGMRNTWLTSSQYYRTMTIFNNQKLINVNIRARTQNQTVVTKFHNPLIFRPLQKVK
jgi:hypothetical protein